MTIPARRRLLLAGAAASLLPQRQAAAQAADYPNRPLKIIVASPVGGLTDNYARMLADHFTARFGQPALVDNRPGAGGIVGIEALVKSPPDGYTILFGSTGMFFQARVMYRKLPYDLDKDITPIAVFPTGPLALAATEASGIRDYKGMIERARTTRTTMGNYVAGSYQQILAETWNREHGCKFELINYKGEVPMWVDMASGQIDVAIGSYQAFAKVRDKGLRPIGVTGRGRSPRMPEVPTMIEQGFSGPVSRLEAAIILVAHSAVPVPLLDFLSKVAVETNDTARSRTMRESMGVPDAVAGRTEGLRMWREDGPVWIREVKALNLPVT
ncbi:MAG: tripartite tricarboxylate transporter substrate binding protein [Burkholderiaceae bacterium]|nr:tripartite tricarboxylate transporter substrate binding protein [Burkholderiaceae bacterium]